MSVNHVASLNTKTRKQRPNERTLSPPTQRLTRFAIQLVKKKTDSFERIAVDDRKRGEIFELV